MKLNYQQLATHLNGKLSSIYLISGEDIFLKQEAIQSIRKTAKQAGYEERIRFTGEEGPAALYQLLYTSSLFTNKRLLELRFRQGHPSKEIAAILLEYAKEPKDDTLLIIEMGKADSSVSKQAWYQTLDKIGCQVTIWPIAREQLPQWITQRAKKYQMQIQQDAAQFIADYVEGNLVAASSALEKIYLSKPTTAIDVALVHEILNDESSFTVFDLVDNLIASERERSLHILEKLKNDGIEPVLILWGITRELRLLAELAQQINEGTDYELLMKKNKIFFKRQASVRRFLSQKTVKDCWQYLHHASLLDQIIKGTQPGNIWDALQLFCLRF